MAISLDLGSNTFRALEYECIYHKKLAEYTKTVKTADGLAKSGKISDEAIARVVSAILEAGELMDIGSKPLRAVTTEALRRATNSSEVLDRIESATGVRFEIISGQEEARLTLLAIEHRIEMLGIEANSFVSIDIGGGSTEVTFVYGESVISRSFPIGIVTTTQSYSTLDEISQALPQEMSDIAIFVENIQSQYGRADIYLATAGTPTTLASMKHGFSYATYDAKMINGTTINIDEIDIYLHQLEMMTPIDRELTVGVGRYDLILTGTLIYKTLYQILGFESCIVIDDGLREGVVHDICTEADSY